MSDRVRALLVDDEPLACASLRAALAAHEDWEVVGEADGAESARRAIAADRPDVVFLDIRMPGESGLALARDLASSPAPPVIVFLTAHDEHAVAAFGVHAIDYLLKPLDDARLAETLDRVRALRRLEWRAAYGDALRSGVADASATAASSPFLDRFCVRSVGRLDVIPLATVRWLQSAGNYVSLHTADGRTVLHRAPLSDVEGRLDPAVFIRVHRGTVVRRSECAALTVTGDRTYRLKLHGGGRVAVSARYVEAVRAVLLERS